MVHSGKLAIKASHAEGSYCCPGRAIHCFIWEDDGEVTERQDAGEMLT